MLQAPSGTICSDIVFLFKPRMRHSALRVTETIIYLILLIFRTALLVQLLKKMFFSLFRNFFENYALLYSQFQPTNNLQILNVNSSSQSSERDLPKNKIKSKIECMKLNQKLTFQRKRYKYVASLLRDDLPRHRITLRAEDKPSYSTSHSN